MAATPTLADHGLVAAGLAASVMHWRWAYPRAAGAIAAGVAGARLRFYRYVLLVTWAMAAAVAGLWLGFARPAAELGVRVGTPWRLGLGLGLAALYLRFALRQRRAVLARPDLLARLGRSYSAIRPMIPETAAEGRGFRAVAITAGICEELYFRGFLLWYVAGFGGPVLAILLSAAAFGFDHLYLGRGYVVRTGIGGVAFALLVALAGSLWPAMLVHAVADLVSGDLGAHALRFADRASAAEQAQSAGELR